MTECLLTAGIVRPSAHAEVRSGPFQPAGPPLYTLNTRAEFIPLTEHASGGATGSAYWEHVCAFCASSLLSSKTLTEDKCMKRITMAAIMIAGAGLLASAAPAATPSGKTRSFQQSCANAPAVARAYLASQVASGHKLTMSRTAAIAELTKI